MIYNYLKRNESSYEFESMADKTNKVNMHFAAFAVDALKRKLE